jgi:hypothetical protein
MAGAFFSVFSMTLTTAPFVGDIKPFLEAGQAPTCLTPWRQYGLRK